MSLTQDGPTTIILDIFLYDFICSLILRIYFFSFLFFYELILYRLQLQNSYWKILVDKVPSHFRKQWA